MAGDGQRRYQYAAADPVNGMDPTGNADLVEYRPLCCAKGPPILTPSLPWCTEAMGGPMGGLLPGCRPDCLPSDECSHQHEVTVSFWPYAAAGNGHVGVGVDSPDFNEFTWGFATLNQKSSKKEHACINEAGTIKHDQDTYPFKAVDYMRIPTDAAGADAMQQAIDNRANNPGSYNVCFRNCAMFVESVLTKGNIQGAFFAPPGIIWPKLYWSHLGESYSWYSSFNY